MRLANRFTPYGRFGGVADVRLRSIIRDTIGGNPEPRTSVRLENNTGPQSMEVFLTDAEALDLANRLRDAVLGEPPAPSKVCARCLHHLAAIHPQSGPCIIDSCSCKQFVSNT